MLDTFFPLLIGLILVAVPAWVLGWHFGAATFRDRTKKFQTALSESNDIYERWAATPHGKEYQAGYTSGVADTLSHLAAFLEKAEGKNAPRPTTED